MPSASNVYLKMCLCGLGLLLVSSAVGCQSDYAGQTLPSPYWLVDDVQYFPAGPEFKLTNEAIALKTYGADKAVAPQVGPLGPPPGAPRPGLIEPAPVVVPGAAGGVGRPGVVVPAVPPAAPAAEVPPVEAPPAAEDPFANP